MKKIQILFYSFLAIALVSCVDEDLVNQERDGPNVSNPRLDVLVVDSDGNPISGATVDFFASGADYANEENSIKTVTTGADGIASLEESDVDGEPGQYYFNVVSGSLRNWIDVTSAPYILWTTGPTVVTVRALSVIDEFLDLTAADYMMTSYTYAGGNVINAEPCSADDIFTFRKDGVIIRREGATECADPSEDQAPVSVEGEIWGTWSLNDDGTKITLRDLDPFYESPNVNVEADLTTSESGGTITVTIDYGSPYVATLESQ